MSDALKDLAIVPVTSSDTNYFLRKVTGLKIDKIYSFKFQWVLEDGTLSDWSPGYQISTPTENVPLAVTATVPSTSVGNIPVTLPVFPANTKRVDIYVIGGSYGTGKVVDSFLAAGTKTISISEPGEYQVSLIAVTPSGINGTPTDTFTITVSASSVDTTVLPGAPSSVVVTAFNEPSDPLNRTGYVNVSFVGGSSAKGHSIGIWNSVPGTSDPARIVPSDGTSTKIDGLFVGSSYYFRVRSFNQFNNTSSWVAPAANYPVTIPGTSATPGKVTVSGTGTPKSIVATWTAPASNSDLVTAGGYYIAKLYSNSSATGAPIETKTCYSNTTTFAGLITGTLYYITVQAYTAGATPVAGTLSDVFGPFIPTAIEPPDFAADFILANNQLQVGETSGGSDVHLSAYTKSVAGQNVKGRIYIGGPETSGSAAVGLYNSSGTPFYADNLGRFSLGDRLSWSGSALDVKGNIDVTGPSTFSSYVLSGATNSSFVGIGYQVPYRLSNVLQTGANGLTGIVINSSGTAVNSDYIKSDGTFRLAAGALTFNAGTLNVTGNITANAIAANTDISGATGTFGGALNVGTTILANITGASSVNISGITRVRFIAENALKANDSVNISGIAPNEVFAYWANPPTNTIPIYNYPANPFNLGAVTVYEAGPTYFDIQSGVTGTYTSGGTATGSAFRVSSTGLIRGAAGQIGGWVIDVTKLRSASGSISLDPITPQITIKGSGGYTGYNITLAAPTGITAGSTFAVTPAGYLTSTSGSIAGWNINGSSISKAVPYSDVFGTTGTLTTTLGSDAKITVSSTNGPFGFFNLGIDSAIITENATQKLEIGPNGIGFVNKALNLGVQNGYMRMWTASGDRQFYIYWDGWRTDPSAYSGATSETYAPFQWKWINYSTAAERLTHIGSIAYDLTPQSLRPLVVDTSGVQYLGANSYFSTTQTTTPSAGTGSNGDFYYSTA
jgi:hypothetical protein